MRHLMYFAIGFIVACGYAVYVETAWVRWLVAVVTVVLVPFLGKKKHIWQRCALTGLGCILGFFWFGQFHSLYLAPISPMDGKTVPLAIRASDYGEGTERGTFIDGTVYLEGRSYQIHARLDGNVAVEPGMQFAGQFDLRVTTVEQDDFYNPGKGIFLLAYQKGTVTAVQTRETWLDKTASLRRELKTILKNCFPEDTQPFAKALFLGDTSELSYEMDTDLKVSGIRHVVAVSGLHISILFGLISMLTLRKRVLTALVGYPVLLLFAAVTGFSPSVMRACLMCALLLLGRLANREYDGPTSLSFAALIMLLINPLVVTSVSFQLSVASVAGIFLFQKDLVMWMRSFFEDVKGKSRKARLIRWFTSSVSVTLSAISLTTPLCAYYFGMVSLVGVLTNLLTLWVISGIFYGMIMVCLLYPVFPAMAILMAKLISWPIRYVLNLAKILADFPLAAVYTSSPYIVAWLVFVYGMLAFFLISNNRRPKVLSCCAALGLCMALLADWTEPMLDETRLTVLDVGQGQCLVLQSEGRTFVVDCGGDRDAEAADQAAELLLRQGIGRIDGLILTHLDSDHSGGAPGLLSRMETELLILPPKYSALPEYTDGQTIWAEEDMEITWGNTVLRIFVPRFPGTDNENSLCILFDTKKCDILITGDRDAYGERSLLRNAELTDVDILIAGHHGSANATCEELLTAVMPEIVCISAGAGNLHGHPAPELLERLAQFGCTVYRTDLHGTITIRR